MGGRNGNGNALVFTVGERGDAVKIKPRGPAPHCDISMLKPEAAWLVAALQSAEQKDRGQA